MDAVECADRNDAAGREIGVRKIGQMTNGLGVITNLYKDHAIFAVLIAASLFAGGYFFGH